MTQFNINRDFITTFIHDNPNIQVNFNSEEILTICNGIESYSLFEMKVKAFLYSLKRKQIKKSKIYKCEYNQFFSSDLLNTKQILLSFDESIRIVFLNLYIQESEDINEYIDYTCLIDKLGLILYRDINQQNSY